MIEHYRGIQADRAAGERKDSGFTLIELLIVIVVLGILAAVVVFALGGVTASGAVSACKADAKTVQTAIVAYTTETGNAASTVTGGSTTGSQASNLVTGTTPTLQMWPANTASNYNMYMSSGTLEVVVGGTWTTGTTPSFAASTGAVTTAYSGSSAASACNGAT